MSKVKIEKEAINEPKVDSKTKSQTEPVGYRILIAMPKLRKD